MLSIEQHGGSAISLSDFRKSVPLQIPFETQEGIVDTRPLARILKEDNYVAAPVEEFTKLPQPDTLVFHHDLYTPFKPEPPKIIDEELQRIIDLSG